MLFEKLAPPFQYYIPIQTSFTIYEFRTLKKLNFYLDISCFNKLPAEPTISKLTDI